MHRFKKAESPVSVAGGAATGNTSFIMFPVYAAAGMVGRPCAGEYHQYGEYHQKYGSKLIVQSTHSLLA